MKIIKNRFRLFGLILLAGSLVAGCIDRDFDSPPIERPAYAHDSTISLKNFKAKYNSDLVEITDNDIIMGVVTANDVSGNLYKQIFIDDGETGLMVAIDQNNIYNDYRVGQKVFIETQGLYMGKYGGLAQLGYRYSRNNDGIYTIGQAPWELFKEKIFKHDFPDASKVTPMVIDFGALTEDNFGRLVTFQSVMFDDAGQTFSYPNGGQVQTLNRIIRSSENAGSNITARMSSAANFAGETIPDGIGNVTGILTRYNSTNQILVRDSIDIDFAPNPDGWGTRNSPWSVEYALKHQDEGKTGWVKGVIVGTLMPGVNETQPVSQNEHINFDYPYIMNNYVVIAQTADVRDWTKCVVVNLPENSAIRTALNLVDNPDNIGKEVSITGELQKVLNAAGVIVATGAASEFIFEESGGDTNEPQGTGTKEDPYNYAAALQNQGKTGWVKAVIVGAVDDGNGGGISISAESRFEPPYSVSSNILIAAAAGEINYMNCMPVQLPLGNVRTALNLVNNPNHLGNEVMLYGDLTTYFGVAGIKTVTEYVIDGTGGGGDEPPPDPTDYIFMETFGDGSYQTNRPKIVAFDDFDNTDVTFTDPTGNADIRTTSQMNPHVWFPANKEAQLIIEGINVTGYENIQLSYDFTTNDDAGTTTANMLTVIINGVEQNVPATQVERNVYTNISLDAIGNTGSTMTIEFKATAANNAVGFRLDNIALSEVK